MSLGRWLDQTGWFESGTHHFMRQRGRTTHLAAAAAWQRLHTTQQRSHERGVNEEVMHEVTHDAAA